MSLQNKTSQARMIDFLLLVLNTRNKQFQLGKDLFQLWSKVGWFHVKEEYDGRESLLSLWWENRETPGPRHILQRTFKEPTLYRSTTSKWCIQILKPPMDYIALIKSQTSWFELSLEWCDSLISQPSVNKIKLTMMMN